MNDKKIEQLKEFIDESNNIVFFGGAGVSTESNIPDFRSSDGLFSKQLNQHFSPEELVSHTFYERYPEDFFKFYKDNMIYPDAKPNKAHMALARLEDQGKLKSIITQNIDGLHQKAGSKTVYELHGTVNSNTCERCNAKYNLEEFLNLKGNVPHCSECGARVKPDVVLIVGGISLVVYPAAGFLSYFKGQYLVLINKSSTMMDKDANLIINDSIGSVLDKAIK